MMTKKKLLAETKVIIVQKIERGRKKQIEKQLIYIKRIIEQYLSTWWVLIVYEMTYQEGHKIQLVAIKRDLEEMYGHSTWVNLSVIR